MEPIIRLMWREPAITLFLMGQVVGIAVAFGLSFTAEQVLVLNGFVGGFVALVTRYLVTPTNQID